MVPAMKSVLLALLLLVSGAAFAEADPRLVQLDAAYNRLQQEQQATYQQFLMAQELLRNEQNDIAAGAARGYGAMAIEAGRAVDYDENVRQQREREQRLQRYRADIDQAYVRYLELGNQKRALLEQITQLAQPPRR